ncbi:T-lymphoma invasion and metastasis-inducing protein 2 [Mortierella alpina]|uniref:T-lymphoma invasion and metastasis-inducing protein 2 n=1 Tax=Mortierella alpina TaxID=64518 RepID=A0A9P6IS53_MORAP|nr:T-lymphoma invasion and metastasis-inducing protein 2 [Mortierella alpina]
MVNQGIVAARRSAELDQQYRANATGTDFGSRLTVGLDTPLTRVIYDVCHPPASPEQQGVPSLWHSSLSVCSVVPLQPLQPLSPTKSTPFLPSLRGLATQAGLSFQYRFRFKGRHRRHRVGDDVPSDRKRSSVRLARRDSKRWMSGSLGALSKQASPNLAHHRCVKPLPPLRATSGARKMRSLESLRHSLCRFDKPLPPLPSSSESPDEAGSVIGEEEGYLTEVIPGNERYHDTHSRMADNGASHSDRRLAQEQCDLYADMRNVGQGGLKENDHHPADGLDAAEEIKTHKVNELPHYQLLDECTPMGHGLLTQEIFLALDANNAPSFQGFNSFRFPQSADADMNEAAPKPRPRMRQHSHHQSLPHYSGSKAPVTPTLSPLQAIPHTLTADASAAQSSSIAECIPTSARTASPRDAPVLHRPLEWIEASTSIGKIQRPSTRTERQRRQYSHLRRSESCSFISHRPSLSFNSSKKDLLSLQMRRINKPDAKVNRLPEIQTTAGIGSFSVSGASGQTDSLAGTGTFGSASVLLSGCMLNVLSLTHVANFDGRAMEDDSTNSNRVVIVSTSTQDVTDYQMQVSNKDRGALDTILAELSTADEYRPEATLQESGGHHARSDRDAEGDEAVCESATADASSNTARTEEPATPATISGDLNTSVVDSGLSTALQAFSVDSNPIVDAGEIKRFVKRSHALQELEMTEESYVNDLDILIHVHLRALETKAWFPQILHANMRRCVSGLLALHQEFLLRLRACKMDDSDRESHAPLRVYKNLAGCFEILNHDNYLYGVFCELRVRTINEINRTVGQAAVALLQKEGKELLAQQGRPKSRVDLKDCLIKPIQRICRYPLLLKEILRLTSLDDPEYQHVQQAHEVMKGMAQEMDETQRVVERKLLTEQFLKKLPDTNFPKKVSSTPSREHSNCHASIHPNGHGNSNSSNTSAPPHPPSKNTHGIATVAGAQPGPSPPLDGHFEFDPSIDGIPSSPLTKAYAGTLGSIVLAGALEYVIIPDMPIRLKYYGCFLFETMLIIVKAKKSNLYEPRQWLPLRLCELHETTRLDGRHSPYFTVAVSYGSKWNAVDCCLY